MRKGLKRSELVVELLGDNNLSKMMDGIFNNVVPLLTVGVAQLIVTNALLPGRSFLYCIDTLVCGSSNSDRSS